MLRHVKKLIFWLENRFPESHWWDIESLTVKTVYRPLYYLRWHTNTERDKEWFKKLDFILSVYERYLKCDTQPEPKELKKAHKYFGELLNDLWD